MTTRACEYILLLVRVNRFGDWTAEQQVFQFIHFVVDMRKDTLLQPNQVFLRERGAIFRITCFRTEVSEAWRRNDACSLLKFKTSNQELRRIVDTSQPFGIEMGRTPCLWPG